MSHVSAARRLAGHLAFCLCLASGLGLSSTAMAQEAAPATPPPPAQFEATFRVRAIHVPSFVLDTWFDQHANTWDEGANMSYGAEIAWRNLASGYQLGLAVDWADLSMQGAFWKEEGEPDSAAKYTEVDMQVLSLTLSSAWYFDVLPWFSPYVGAGIGAGLVLGDIVKFRARQGSACRQQVSQNPDGTLRPPDCFDADGNPREDQINFDDPENEEDFLPVLPMVQAMAGARFNIEHYGVLKVELGIHDYVYAALSFGVQW